jgi:hypothetical protein
LFEHGLGALGVYDSLLRDRVVSLCVFRAPLR